MWGRLVVATGTVDLVFEDDNVRIELQAGDHSAIPPGRPHHVELGEGAEFYVEFHV